jgi:hypothetical protein
MRDRAGATPRTFWADESRKSGVAPARFSVFSNVTFHLTEFPISCSSKKLLAPQGEELGEDEAEVCIPYLLHSPCSKLRTRTSSCARVFKIGH